MMSNPPPMLQPSEGLHRRQNSTPTIFGGTQAQNLPRTSRPASSHRRGQSLDLRRRQYQPQQPPPTTPQGGHGQHRGSMVSSTNPGSTTTGHQILREAQQQHLARPGQTNPSPMTPRYDDLLEQTIDQNTFYNSTTIETLLQEQANLQLASPLESLLPQDSYMPRSAGPQSTTSHGGDSRQHSFQSLGTATGTLAGQTMMERSMSQPNLRLHTEQRPNTPAQQIQNAKPPLTPATTPFQQAQRQVARPPPRPAHSSPIKKAIDCPVDFSRPISMPRTTSLDDIFEDFDHEVAVASPASSVPAIAPATFEVAEMPTPKDANLPSMSMNFDYTGISQAPSGPLAPSGGQSGQGERKTPLFGEIDPIRPIVGTPFPLVPSSQPGTSCSSPTRAGLSPRRMSISDLHLEPGVTASIEETNVTLDDIAQFIEGPDPVDNKWICKYDECNKRFGRKENIKSHVQTHLGDRQFRCDHCQKCFVRGHDLKRHAKIHTGSKPYPCLCGNSFARHDALTRHRQRGNCVGAFEGVVRKVAKKGRPRKRRPDMDDRLDKANRTRRRVEEREHHYASSATDSSASSFGSPPPHETFESLSMRGTSPFDDPSLFGMITSSVSEGHHADSLPLDLFSFTPPTSPGYSTGNRPSPYHREVTPNMDTIDMAQAVSSETEVTMAPHLSAPAATTTASPTSGHNDSNIHERLLAAIVEEQPSSDDYHHTTPPPSLCHSSSSPVADLLSFDMASFQSHEPSIHVNNNNSSSIGGSDTVNAACLSSSPLLNLKHVACNCLIQHSDDCSNGHGKSSSGGDGDGGSRIGGNRSGNSNINSPDVKEDVVGSQKNNNSGTTTNTNMADFDSFFDYHSDPIITVDNASGNGNGNGNDNDTGGCCSGGGDMMKSIDDLFDF